MFQDCTLGTVGFKPTGKGEKITKDADSQTSEYKIQEASVQSKEYYSNGIQTDEVIQHTNVVYDEAKLGKFLKKVYPLLLEEFKKPTPQIANVDDEYGIFSGKIEKVCEIKNSLDVSDDQVARIIALDWKSEDNVLCIGYCFEHRDWCTHNNVAQVYHLKMSSESKPVSPKTLKTPSCVTKLAYHPHLPILAVAMYSGEIIIWNINKDSSISTSRLQAKNSSGHKDTITQISWIRNVDVCEKQPMLVSSSCDGFIMLWQYNPFADELIVCAKMEFQMPNTPNKERSNLIYGLLKMNVGVTCFSFTPVNSVTFIAGMQGGEILKCTITDMPLQQKQRQTRTYKFCPVVGHYEPHEGSVTDVRHVKRDLRSTQRFVTSGLDKIIKIFEEEQDTPIYIFNCQEEVLGLTYFEPEEQLILAWGWNGLHLYDICTQNNVQVPDIGKETKKTNYTSLASNGRNLVAVGNTNTEIHIWKMPDLLKGT